MTLPDRPDKATTALIWDGVELDRDAVGALQPPWDIPSTIAIKADIGHHHHAPEVIRHSIECVEAGACAVHLHIRDDAGKDTGDMGLWREVVGAIRSHCGDEIVIDSGFRGSTFEERTSHIREGLFDIVPVIPTWDGEYLGAAIEVLNEHGVRPEFCIWDATDISLVRSQLFARGLIDSPSLWLIVPSSPYFGMPMPTPSLAVRGVPHLIDLVLDVDPDAHISVSASGRGSSYLTTLGMLLGHHVRPGIGETHWRHPHVDDRETPDPALLIADAVQVATGLGRTPATAAEYRAMVAVA
jgi:uncharacterized protein (DUF849 family)